MEYRTLEHTDLIYIYEAFNQAFSDYQVSVKMPMEAFERRLKRKGFMPKASVGAFDNGRLAGFILNGVRNWDGERTVYDLGAGVLPDFRRTGIMEKLLDLTGSLCIEHAIRVYQLEVIQDNEKAVALYKKQGFQIERTLNCYQMTGKAKEEGEYKTCKLEHPEKLDADQWMEVKKFWNYPPSWQNAIDSVCAVADSFSYTLAELDGRWIGYGIVDKETGDIAQLAVHPGYRRIGAGTEMLLDLHKQMNALKMRAVNVDERDHAFNAFLKKMGFDIFVKQYEMRKYFSV